MEIYIQPEMMWVLNKNTLEISIHLLTRILCEETMNGGDIAIMLKETDGKLVLSGKIPAAQISPNPLPQEKRWRELSRTMEEASDSALLIQGPSIVKYNSRGIPPPQLVPKRPASAIFLKNNGPKTPKRETTCSIQGKRPSSF